MLEPAVLEHVKASQPDDPAAAGPLDPSERREAATRAIDRIFRRFGLAGPTAERVVDHRVPVQGGSILVRSYHPANPASSTDSTNSTVVPAHIYLHGGGWTSGSIDELVCDATARHRAVSAHCVTLVVEYRLAPEHRFPTAVHDVVAVVRWVREHASRLGIDPDCITLGGASAGANLAAAAVLVDPHLGLRALLLEVPALDLRNGGELAIPADIDSDDVDWIEPMRADYRSAVADYLATADLGDDPLASPLLAPDLSKFPETYLFTAELDILRPGAEQFAERLRVAGVPTHITCYRGALHGSPILNATWSTARQWHDDSLAILRRINAGDQHEAI